MLDGHVFGCYIQILVCRWVMLLDVVRMYDHYPNRRRRARRYVKKELEEEALWVNYGLLAINAISGFRGMSSVRA